VFVLHKTLFAFFRRFDYKKTQLKQALFKEICDDKKNDTSGAHKPYARHYRNRRKGPKPKQ
jgi:hypothetical protein